MMRVRSKDQVRSEMASRESTLWWRYANSSMTKAEHRERERKKHMTLGAEHYCGRTHAFSISLVLPPHTQTQTQCIKCNAYLLEIHLVYHLVLCVTVCVCA